MSMISFRDALNKAASHQPSSTAPAATPSFLADMAEAAGTVVAAHPAPTTAATQAPANVTSALPARTQAAPTQTTGFGAMLQRVAESRGATVVSVLSEAAPAPVVQPYVEAAAAPVQIEEGLLDGLGPILNKITNPIGDKEVGEGILSKHHSSAHDHIDAAMSSLAKAHSDVSRSHELATSDVHKARLKHQMGQLSTAYQGLGHAKEAGNIANHEYMKSTGNLS